ncbi:hypothetical protein HUT16_04330 [Kitasatospora sp. NA04385]|uniref:hypothetical protein n=1 Tax=Kitasatospora sp. NA04385 TaxID=2742135 RepID=UPI001591A892|nr:hypothetical protein [Kitasatospora sp. NA04385]QKW18396.1 hypothetical protein HUT16_04330 [Kitasatospora sp. NA04385]
MTNADHSVGPVPTAPVPEPRSVQGTVWRTLVVLLVYFGAGAAGTWAGAKALDLDVDSRIVSLLSVVPGLAVIVLGLLVLRAGPWFAAVPGIATSAAICAATMGVHYRLVADGRIRLDTFGIRLLAGSLALGFLVSFLGVLAAAVSGHLRPYVSVPKEPTGTVPPAAG